MPDVFISYSRMDEALVRRLHDALVALKRSPWVDWADIPPSSDWMKEIESNIEQSHAFVFVISPDSVASRICLHEIAYAAAQNKKLVPVLFREPKAGLVPEVLAKLNYVHFREKDDFDHAVGKLTAALDTDLDWVRDHTRLLVRAREWETERRANSYVLRGSDLQNAEQWLSAADTHPEARPTTLQTEYILASRRATTRRRQITLGGVALAGAVAIALGALAKDRRQVALSRQLAAESLHFLHDQLDRSLLLAVAAQQTRDTVEARNSLLTALKYSPRLETYLHSESGSALSLAFSNKGALASGHKNGAVLLWDTAGARITRALKDDESESEIWSVAFSQDGATLASGNADGRVFVWDPETGTQRGPPLSPHENLVTSLAFSPDGETLASASTSPDGIIVLDNVRNHASVQFRGSHRDAVWALAFSPDGQILASGSDDQTVVLLKVKDPEQKSEVLVGHRDRVRAVAYSPDGKLLASGDGGGTIILWDAATRRQAGNVLTRHKLPINSLAFRLDGGMLASGDAGGTILLWDVATRQPINLELVGERKTVNSLAFSPDGRILASGHGEGKILLWDLAASQTLASHHDEVTSVAFSRDGRLMASGGKEGTIILRDMTTGQHFAFAEDYGGGLRSVSFTTTDGHGLAAGYTNGAIMLWDANTGRIARGLRAPNEADDSGAQSAASGNGVVAAIPDRGIVLSGSAEGPVTMWNTKTGEHCELGEGKAHAANSGGEVMSLSVTPDGEQLASGRVDGAVFVWSVHNASSGGSSFRHELNGEYSQLRSVSFSPDGRMLASGSTDGTLVLWDARQHIQTATLRDPANVVWTLAFSPDSELLASGNAEGSVMLWNVPELGPVGNALTGHSGGVNTLAFQPGGQRMLMASGSEDANVLSWTLPSVSDWKHDACRIANRTLTQEELPMVDDEARRNFCSTASRRDYSPIVDRKRDSDLEWPDYRRLCKEETRP